MIARLALLSGSALLALAASPAFAQDVAAPPAAQPPSVAPPAPTQATPESVQPPASRRGRHRHHRAPPQ